jgi:hypothetical protein
MPPIHREEPPNVSPALAIGRTRGTVAVEPDLRASGYPLQLSPSGATAPLWAVCRGSGPDCGWSCTDASQPVRTDEGVAQRPSVSLLDMNSCNALGVTVAVARATPDGSSEHERGLHPGADGAPKRVLTSNCFGLRADYGHPSEYIVAGQRHIARQMS